MDTIAHPSIDRHKHAAANAPTHTPPHKTHRPGRLGALDSVDPSIAQHPSTPHITNGHHLVGHTHDSIIVASRIVYHKSMGKRKAKIGGYGKPGKLDIVFDEQARRCVGWNGLMI